MENLSRLGWHYNQGTGYVTSPTGEVRIYAPGREPKDVEVVQHAHKLLLQGRTLPSCVEHDAMLAECALITRIFPLSMFK